MVYPALLPLMRTLRLSAVDWTDAPCRFKWTRPFRRKMKSGFCACDITFQTHSTLAECTSTVFREFGLRAVQWTETCGQVFNIDYQYKLCYWLNSLLYYCEHSGMAQTKKNHFQSIIQHSVVSSNTIHCQILSALQNKPQNKQINIGMAFQKTIILRRLCFYCLNL
jgi:hypothetical protein